MFKQATRQQSKLRMTIDGPAGSGKTYTALRFAHTLAAGGRIAVLDTERGSASKYVGEAPDGIPWQFDVAELTTFSPDKYTQLIEMAGRSGYAVLIIDSLSHAWEGKEGALEKVGGNVTNWKNATPLHQRMVDAILQAPMHVITTMRSRMEHVIDRNEAGKVIGVRKVGMAPIQRPGMEYEFDLVCDMDWLHILTVSKSRCSAVADMVVDRPGPSFMAPVIEWLTSGVVQVTNPVFVPAEEPVVAPENMITLDMLLDAFSAEAILEANEGKLPETDAEVLDLAKRLGVA
jgi:hypothetical protein